MILSFELTMPNVGSWNGKWTGADKKYFIHRTLSKSHPLCQRFKEIKLDNGLAVQSGVVGFHYRWDDGWSARVTVNPVTSKMKAKEEKLSAGFCGYGWMVDSIIKNGKILTD